jgi:hypothetical protein
LNSLELISVDTAIYEKIKVVVLSRNQGYVNQLNQLPEPMQTAVSALSKLSLEEQGQVIELVAEYRKLKGRQDQWKQFTEVTPEVGFVFGKPYSWSQFWMERLLGEPIDDLSRLPYRQCHWCGKAGLRKNAKHFCNESCAEAFRKWRDNVRRVGKAKPESVRIRYYLDKVEALFEENRPPELNPVAAEAYRMASQWVQQLFYAGVPAEDRDHPMLLQQEQALRNKLTSKLLKQYRQRRKLDIQALSDTNVTPDEMAYWYSPGSCWNEESLRMKPIKNRRLG